MPRLYTKKANRGAKKERNCQKCRQPIVAGDQFYQWCPRASRSGSGYNRYQHTACGRPSQSQLYPYNKMSPVHDAVSEASDLLGQIEVPSTADDAASYVEAVRDALNTAAETAEGVADEYTESADNIEQGFGTRTYQCDELEEKAEMLRTFAETLQSWEPSREEPDLSDLDAPGETDVDDEDANEALETALADWAEEVRSEADDALNEFEG